MFFISHPSEQQIQLFLSRQNGAHFSYRDIGATREERVPAGFVADHHRTLLGDGPVAWDAAKWAICHWEMFDIPWLQLRPPNPLIEKEVTLAILISHFGFWSLNASRIVYVIDEDGRLGFAYGTLQEHGESGEERFIVELDRATGNVFYDLLAFSRPNATLARFARPLARRLQKQFASDSMQAMINAVKIASV